jgi:AcrR family transcriptional regulator
MAGVKGQVQARGVERRRAIVAAAIEHFAQNGYHGTAIADIAKQAGVTTGGLLHHFGSKESLLVEVIRQRDHDAIGAISSLEHDSIAGHFDEWLSVAAWNEEREPYVALHAVLLTESIDPDHPAHAYFTARNGWLLELLSDALRNGVERGELRDDFDVTSKAREIQAFVEGAAIMWLFDPEPGGLQNRYRSYFDDQLAVLRAH